MQDDLKGEASSHVFIEIIPDKNGSFRFEDHSTFKLDRNIDDFVGGAPKTGYFGIQMSAFRRYEHPF